MTDPSTTTLHFTGRARAAAAWLVAETGVTPLASALSRRIEDVLHTVVLPDWDDAKPDEQAVHDTLRSLSTRSYLLDVKSLSQAGVRTRRACLQALGIALDVDREQAST